MEHKTGYDFLETSGRLSLGWLSPDGTFYPCSRFEHTEKAQEIANSYYPYDKNADPEVTLMNHRYVKVIKSFSTGLFEIFYDFYKTLSHSQIDFLYPYMTIDKMEPSCIERIKLEMEY